MDFENLNIILGADDTDLGRGLNAAIAKLTSFGTTANAIAAQAGAGFARFAADAGASGSRAADQFASGFNSVNAKLAGTFKDLDKRREELEKGYGRLGESFKSVGQGLTIGVTAPLLGLSAAAVNAFADMEALEKGFFAVYKGAGNANEELEKTKELAKLPGLGLEEVVKGSTRLQAVGISAEQARKSIEAFGNAIATTGGGKSEFDRVTVQLGQLSAKGKVLSQDLRPIIEAAPIVAQSLQKMFGTVDSEAISAALAKAGKSSKDFIVDLTNDLNTLPKVAGGAKNAMENMADDIKKSLASVGGVVVKTLGLEDLAGNLGETAKRITTAFANLPAGTQKAILGIAGVAAAIGPLSLAIGGVLAILPTLGAGFAVLTGPIGLTIAAVAAGAVLIISNWDTISAYFKSDAGKPFVEIVSTIGDSLKTILSLVGDFSESFGGLFSAAFKGALSLILPILSELVGEINGSLKTINALVKLGSADNAREWASGYDALAAITKNKSDSLLGLVASFAKSAIDLYLAAEEKIAGISFVPQQKGVSISTFFAGDFAGKAASEWEATANASLKAAKADEQARLAAERHAKTLGGLKEALKAAKDQLDTQIGGTAEFDATKAEIVRLGELIKKLEDTGKAAKKASDDIAKAFADIKAKLAGVDTRVRLGVEVNYDGVQEKIKILQDGIKSLTDKGLGVNNPGIQRLNQQLVGVQAQLQKIKDSFTFLSTAKLSDGSDIYAVDVAKIQKELDAAKLTAQVAFEFDGDKTKLANALADAQKAATDKLAAAQVPASTPGAQAISSQVKPLAADAFNADSLREYLQAMKDISAEQQVFGAGFNGSAAAMSVTAQRLRDLIALGQTGTAEFATLSEQMKELKQAADWSDLQQNIGDQFASMIAQLGSVVGEQLAAVINGTATGQDALSALFSGVLGVIGGFLKEIGSGLIAYGVAMEAFKKAFSNPYAAIAAGAALIIIGSILSSAASAGPTGSGGGGGGYRPTTSGGSSPSAAATKTNKLAIEVTFAPVELRADGASLRSVMKVDSYRLTQNR